MKLENTYFEDIFMDIIILWKSEYYLEAGNKTPTYIKSLGIDFDDIEYTVEIENLGKKYNVWHFMMLFTTYQVLTEVGLEYLKKGKTKLLIEDIPIADFEKQFLDNLKFEGNEKFLKKYKGLKGNY